MKVIKSNSQTKENLLANIRAVTNLFRSSWCFGWLRAHRIEVSVLSSSSSSSFIIIIIVIIYYYFHLDYLNEFIIIV